MIQKKKNESGDPTQRNHVKGVANRAQEQHRGRTPAAKRVKEKQENFNKKGKLRLSAPNKRKERKDKTSKVNPSHIA